MSRGDDEAFTPLPGADRLRVPEPPGGEEIGETEEARSLLADLETLIEDGRTYLEAEANFQKTRAVFIADRVRAAALFGMLGGALGFIALIGLTVGLIIALAPFLTVWGSSALVVGIEALLAAWFGHKAMQRWDSIMDALGMEDGK